MLTPNPDRRIKQEFQRTASQSLFLATGEIISPRSFPRNVRFYTNYYEFYRQGGFGAKFPCRHPSKLISMKPDGSIHLPCAFVTLFKSQAPVKEIFSSPVVKKIISQEETLWDFCKGCKIGCPYEVSAFTNSPTLAVESALDFLRI